MASGFLKGLVKVCGWINGEKGARYRAAKSGVVVLVVPQGY